MKEINWGILAPGSIAHKFAQALQGVEDANLYSVASRNSQRASSFADQYGFTKAADDYEALLADPNVDAIYIASPHMVHAEQSIACLNAGKAVLCEKPMTVNADDAEKVIAIARETGTFYMEAVWTRFMPIYQQIRQWISDGLIGEVHMVQASFGFGREFDPDNRLFDPNLAGGALLDMGIYPITFAQWVFGGTPQRITALSHLGKSGVDERIGMVLQYDDGQIASLNSTVNATTMHDAWIYGSKGNIRVPLFWCANSASLIIDGVEQTIDTPHKVNGYEWEIKEVHRCLEQGLIESPVMSWQESVNVMRIMDEIRAQIGLEYPFEG